MSIKNFNVSISPGEAVDNHSIGNPPWQHKWNVGRSLREDSWFDGSTSVDYGEILYAFQ